MPSSSRGAGQPYVRRARADAGNPDAETTTPSETVLGRQSAPPLTSGSHVNGVSCVVSMVVGVWAQVGDRRVVPFPFMARPRGFGPRPRRGRGAQRRCLRRGNRGAQRGVGGIPSPSPNFSFGRFRRWERMRIGCRHRAEVRGDRPRRGVCLCISVGRCVAR